MGSGAGVTSASGSGTTTGASTAGLSNSDPAGGLIAAASGADPVGAGSAPPVKAPVATCCAGSGAVARAVPSGVDPSVAAGVVPPAPTGWFETASAAIWLGRASSTVVATSACAGTVAGVSAPGDEGRAGPSAAPASDRGAGGADISDTPPRMTAEMMPPDTRPPTIPLNKMQPPYSSPSMNTSAGHHPAPAPDHAQCSRLPLTRAHGSEHL